MTPGIPLRQDDVLVSGIKPTGVPHLGNVVGMMRPAVALAGEVDSFLFVADLHALTTVRHGAELRGHVHDAAAALLALGVDADRTVLFRQSDVPQILELTWILACLAPNPLLERAHAFKAATSEGVDPSLGLFSYPVLMAADILALGGTLVPVGADQRQHVEITRDLARRFNHAYGGSLPVPRAEVAPSAAMIPGLDGRKMSKRYGNTIPLTATPEERRALVRRIVTDSSAADAPKDPDASAVVEIFRHFAGTDAVRQMAEGLRSGAMGWAEAKNALADALDRELEPVRERFLRGRADEHRLEAILRAGAARARSRADEILASVRELTGIGGPAVGRRAGGSARAGTAGPAAPGIDDRLDEALEMTFPASDPVAIRSSRAGPRRERAHDRFTPMSEAWLRGPVEGVPEGLMPAAHSLLDAREDMERAAEGLSIEQLWLRPGGAASVGFHLRHVCGSTERLLTYARGERLSEAQLGAIALEGQTGEPPETSTELLAAVRRTVEATLDTYRATPPESLALPRKVGRAGLPSTVLGLLFHAAEHARRHAGQVVATAKIIQGLDLSRGGREAR